jgi:hypothetical protein
LFLTRFASKVYLVHRRDSLRASKIMADRATSHEKIQMVWDSVPVEVLGVPEGAVSGLKIKNVKTGAESVLPVKGIFVAIGHIPNTGPFAPPLEVDEGGYFKPQAGSQVQTNVPGIYVAGAWNTAAPFTTGQSTGFARAFVLPVTAVWNRVYMWECPEAIIVAFAQTGPSIATSWSGGGAIGDPGITGLGETDGRVYGVFTSGSNNYNQSNMWANTGDAAFYEAGIAGQSRFGMFVPGTATISGYNRFGAYAPANTFLSRGNEVPLVPVYCSGSLTASLPPPIRLREIWLSRDGIAGQVLSNGGVTLGYVAGANALTTAADAAVLTV